MLKRGKQKFMILVILLALFFILFKFTPLSQYVTKDFLLDFFENLGNQWWGALVFILVYGVGCVFAIPGSLLTPLGGAIFGVWKGFVFNLVGANFGACLAFLMARFLGRDFIKGLMKGGKIAEFDEKIKEHGFATIFRLRLIPLVPFNGLNFGSGFSGVKFRDYFLGSILGMIPGCFIYTYFGSALLEGVKEASQKAFINLAIAAALLIALSFIPTFFKKKGV